MTPLAVLSMNTAVPGTSGTDCFKPFQFSFAVEGAQKASSDAWRCVIVSPRAMPSPPAVATAKLLSRRSKTNSRRDEYFVCGFSISGQFSW